ncbi:hypothetical protein [Peribacillus asahii]|uniref:hypothetical protein n=1 Tax=Peribacillus asahii TaxID=228899 RepID=UPI002079B7E7|nr:hypothetical protein [Peribacillus asahii]USK71760.1 hypothetical protein LIS76_08405 [Peribacillus asahii]
MFEFQSMLQPYMDDIQVLITTTDTTVNGGYDEETGEPIKSTVENTEPINTRGAMLPYSDNEIYQSGGRLTQKSRQLIINMDIPSKAVVVHGSQKYSVENKTGYSDFADFNQYELKWVSAFD